MKLPIITVFMALSLFFCGNSFAQVPVVDEIRITSSWGWNEEERYSEIIIRRQNNGYSVNGTVLENKLIDDLVAATNERPIRRPELNNLGINQLWLSKNLGLSLNGYLTERLDAALPNQKELYYASLKDTTLMQKIVPRFFSIVSSDYYPDISVEIIKTNGRTTKIFSDSQSVLSLPWQISSKSGKHSTYNANISRAISAIMPAGSANKRRLVGEDIPGEIERAVMDEIEDTWDLFGTEKQVPDTVAKIREQFHIETAHVGEFQDGSGVFTARLTQKGYPQNFSILLELPYKKGEVSNLEDFIGKAAKYKKLVFSVKWLRDYILSHPEDIFRLNFETKYSFGSSLRDEFFEEINDPRKKRIVEQVRESQDEIASIEVGGKYFFSQWLILPDRTSVLFSYAAFDSLMKWKIKDFEATDCSNKKCVGAVISSSGKIISK